MIWGIVSHEIKGCDSNAEYVLHAVGDTLEYVRPSDLRAKERKGYDRPTHCEEHGRKLAMETWPPVLRT